MYCVWVVTCTDISDFFHVFGLDPISQEHRFLFLLIMPGHKLAACDFNTIDAKLLCPSCGYILRDAMQLACGDHYCETCLSSMQR